jgi:hypothetical protein
MFPSISCETDLHITLVVMAVGGVCHWRLGWGALLFAVWTSFHRVESNL